MEKQAHHTRLNQRVRLRSEGQDALYPMAYAGSEGWVRKHDFDPLGYPMVFIQWDREHWADNGEPDKWAMEAHFEPIEDDQMTEPDFNNPDFKNFMGALYEQFQAQQEPSVEHEPEKEDIQERYTQALDKATQIAKESGEAFILIVAHKTETEDNIPLFIPRVYNFYASKEGGIAAEMILPSIVDQTVHELGMDALQRAAEESDNDA